MDCYQGFSRRRSSASTYILESRYSCQETLRIPGVETLPDLFRYQVSRRGNDTLFSFRAQPTDNLTTVSYTDALDASSRLANALRTLIPSARIQNNVVGIWFEKSIDLNVAILATTISGSTWLPFDADAPKSRIEVCLADSDAQILLCDKAHYEAAVEATRNLSDCRAVTLEELSRLSCDNQSPVQTIPVPDPNSTAYMIYTSGSTGTPKGIEISHTAALTFCLSERSVLGTGPSDVVWQGFSPAFDMFIEEV
jgi:non-ribosomal peptide synthetase component F